MRLSICLRFVCVVQPLGRCLIPPGKKKADDGDAVKSAIGYESLRKWNESCWFLTFFLSAVCIAFLAAVNEPWFTSTTHFWLGCTQLPCDKHIPQGVLLLYVLQSAYYLQAIPTLLWEPKKKDFWGMLGHHIVTLFLLSYSFHLNFTSVGCMIMLCHDFCDVCMEAAKLARRAEYELLTNILFGIFVLVWVGLRLVYFPFVVIWSCVTEPIPIIAIPYNVNPEPHYTVFNILLIFLVVLHLYWSYLIAKVVHRAITKSSVDDVREDESDDD